MFANSENYINIIYYVKFIYKYISVHLFGTKLPI